MESFAAHVFQMAKDAANLRGLGAAPAGSSSRSRRTTTRTPGRTIAEATSTTLEAAPWRALHAAATTTTLELATPDVWRTSWTDAALLDIEPIVAESMWVGGNGSVVGLRSLEVDESAVLNGYVS